MAAPLIPVSSRCATPSRKPSDLCAPGDAHSLFSQYPSLRTAAEAKVRKERGRSSRRDVAIFLFPCHACVDQTWPNRPPGTSPPAWGKSKITTSHLFDAPRDDNMLLNSLGRGRVAAGRRSRLHLPQYSRDDSRHVLARLARVLDDQINGRRLHVLGDVHVADGRQAHNP